MHIRMYQTGDDAGAYYVCMKTGDFGGDGEPFFAEDPDALGRIYVGPYLRFDPNLALMLVDDETERVLGYALGTLESHHFFQRYEKEWRPDLVRKFAEPTGEPKNWTRIESTHHLYHHPDYFCPEPYADYPAHLHIDLLPEAQGQGFGRQMMERLIGLIRDAGAVGVHLGMSISNDRAYGFYQRLGFQELIRDEESIYMGKRLSV